MADVLASTLDGTTKRGNASREFHVEISVMGLANTVRGAIEELTDQQLVLKEVELSKNGNWLEVDCPPIHILREVITTARVFYLDGGS